MSLKDEYSFGEFCDLFRMNPDYEDAYTYEGLETLFDMADELGYDYDAPQICGDFDEFESPADAADYCGVDYDFDLDDDADIIDALNRAGHETRETISGGVVVQYAA